MANVMSSLQWLWMLHKGYIWCVTLDAFSKCVCFCASAGEQRATRAVGNKSRSFHDPEEGRCVRKHVVVAVVNQHRHEFTQELELALWLLYELCSVCCKVTVAPQTPPPTPVIIPFLPDHLQLCSWCGAQDSVPICWFRHKPRAHTSLLSC